MDRDGVLRDSCLMLRVKNMKNNPFPLPTAQNYSPYVASVKTGKIAFDK